MNSGDDASEGGDSANSNEGGNGVGLSVTGSLGNPGQSGFGLSHGGGGDD
ncbi:MAG: hypothetical protein HIU84_10820 [Acidobacteria bacterium]|nr:hypothetical protein [Acidobacteriota bacterium]